MKARSIIQFLLLAFVATGVVFAIAGIGRNDSADPSSDERGANPGGETETAAAWTAYYFHAPHRCPTCRNIEQYSREALAAEIDRGEIEWRVADYTAPENRELALQFGVMTSTVVLVHRQDQEVVRWENLEEVWLHTGKRPQFLQFVREAYQDFRKDS